MNPAAVRRTDRVTHGGSDDPEAIDFSANTNPETPDGVATVYSAALDTARRYPPDDYPEFRAAAADYVGCAPDQVVPTPGGLAAIRLAVETTVAAGDTVLVPAPSFGEYAREVRLQGADPVRVAHDRLLSVDPAGHALAVVCYPNNPTGDAYDPGPLRAYADRCRRAGTPLLVDEAFLGFTDRDSLAGRPGAIVARSLTKLFGLPGLRMGFGVATDGHRDDLATARRTWNLSAPAGAVGTYCMTCEAFVDDTRERVREQRTRLREGLRDAYDVHPSVAPFLLVDVGDRDVDRLLAAARERGLVLRDARTFRGLDSHVRVAVGRPAENDELLGTLREFA